jgi:hypothetical protein
MKKPCIALTLAAAATLHAQDATLEHATTEHDSWFSFGPQFGLNLNARFNYLGNGSSYSPGPATGGGINRTYQDGFVKVDSSGNAGGKTWNWGYQNSSQVLPGSILMQSSTATVGSSEDNGNPQHGFDLAFGHRQGTAPGGHWGWQGAFDFMTISVHDSSPRMGTAKLTSDLYSLGGNTPPPAPYAGSFNGPGVLLSDSPTRFVTANSILITGQRTLEAQMYSLRAGPYYEFALGKRWTGRLGGGLALALAESQYSYNETLTFGGGTSIASNGASSGADFLAGGYAEAKLLFAVDDQISLFAGAQYEYFGTFSQTAGNEQAQLDTSGGVNVLFGVEVSF